MEMEKIIADFPKQMKIGLNLSENIKIKGDFKNIIICGMGGSALPGDILSCWEPKIKIPFYVHRGYGLPFYTTKNSLIISISYSGNTEETISALKEAIKRRLKVAVITSGGELEKIAEKNKLPLVKIPSGIPPRLAVGYQFSALAGILINSNIVLNKKSELISVADKLEKTEQEKEAMKIAKKLKDKIIIIYASNRFKQIARIWKISFNENAKIPAFYNYFSELNHNEMIGFTQKISNKFQIIILKSKDDNPRILKRMKLFTNIFRAKKTISIKSIDIREGSLLFKIFSTIILGDRISYYLAREYKIDPEPVKIVEDFKKKLKRT